MVGDPCPRLTHNAHHPVCVHSALNSILTAVHCVCCYRSASKAKEASDAKLSELQTSLDERDQTISALRNEAESGGAASAARVAELEALVAARGGMIEALTGEIKELKRLAGGV